MPGRVESWCIRSGPGTPAWNMAFDEAMLLACSELGRPLLRFYSWTQASASFGYFQGYADVAPSGGGRVLVRRCTGGGLVLHEGDWTYSLAYPPGHERHRARAAEGYRQLHEHVAGAFRRLGADAWLAEECDACGSGRCFVGHEVLDVIGETGKIAGAAQRRTRNGLLIQGSVQSPPGIDRKQWEDEFVGLLDGAFRVMTEDAGELSEIARNAGRLAEGKYSRDDFLKRR